MWWGCLDEMQIAMILKMFHIFVIMFVNLLVFPPILTNLNTTFTNFWTSALSNFSSNCEYEYFKNHWGRDSTLACPIFKKNKSTDKVTDFYIITCIVWFLQGLYLKKCLFFDLLHQFQKIHSTIFKMFEIIFTNRIESCGRVNNFCYRVDFVDTKRKNNEKLDNKHSHQCEKNVQLVGLMGFKKPPKFEKCMNHPHLLQ